MFEMWKMSRIDATIWLVTGLGVVILDVSYGLILGVLFAVGVLIYRGQHPTMTKLGHIKNTDLYVQPALYGKV